MVLDAHGARCDELRPDIKSIDSDFDIFFDVTEESYHIMHRDVRFQTVHHTGITQELFEHLRHIVYLNKNGLVLDHLEEHELKEELKEEKRLSDMAEDMAKNLRRPLINDYLY